MLHWELSLPSTVAVPHYQPLTATCRCRLLDSGTLTEDWRFGEDWFHALDRRSNTTGHGPTD